MQPDLEDRGRLEDIIAYGERALRHLGRLSHDEFVANETCYDAVVRCMAVVGEAAWKLSKEFQAAHPATPWLLIATMRHKLVHDYGSIDTTIIYRSAREYLPELIEQCRQIASHDALP